MHFAKLAASLLVLLALVAGPAPARAETVNCTPITALPAAITKPGVYDGGASQGHVIEEIRSDQNTYIGIEVQGSGNIVRNNLVVATGGSTLGGVADAIGIFVTGAGPQVLNNAVINTVKQSVVGSIAFGILLQSATGGLVVNNRITTADHGIDLSGGTGKYRDNLTFDVPTATRFLGGTDAGNNN